MNNPKPINCEEAIKHLFEYLDREMEGELQQQMQQHMASCRSCFSRLEFEQTLKAHIRNTATAHAPESLRNRVSKLLNEFEKKSRGGR